MTEPGDRERPGRRHVVLVPPQEPVLHREEMVDGSRRVAGARGRSSAATRTLHRGGAAGWKCETMFVVTPNLPVKMAVWDGCVGMSDANALVKRDPSAGEAIEVRGQPALVTEAAETIRTQRVHRDEDDVHVVSFYRAGVDPAT